MDKIIDINVSQTVKSVSFNVTPNLITINVNKVQGGLSSVTSVNGQVGDVTLTIPSIAGLVPYTGAIQDVNLGEFGVQLGNIEFDTTPTNIPTSVGSMAWNDTEGTADLKLKGGNVTLQIGLEQLKRVVNKTATNITLSEGNYQAVRITGAIGQRSKVDLALADNDLNSAATLGLVTENILNNQEGFITTSGEVKEINTTGSLQGETWLDGDMLYLSGTVAGQITNIKPIAPIHTIIIGFVEYAHAIHGKIFVKVNNGYELEELHNVSAIAPNNNEVLAYDLATTLWKPKTLESILPPITITDTFVVASQTAMLSIVGETGDVAVRTDINKTFILKETNPTVLGNWQELLTPLDSVNSVFNRTGNVVATSGDYTADQITETATRKFQTANQKAFNDATSSIQTQLNAKAIDINVVHLTGNETIAGVKTLSTAPILSSLVASQLLALDASKNIQSLPVATYPSLTELSYVKGVTSRAQIQLDALKLELIYLGSDDTYFDSFYIRTVNDGATFEASNSLLSTMANLYSISYVPTDVIKQINADKFVQLGGTVEKYLMANGSALSNIATNTTTTALSLATLNSTYPTAIIGFRVHCISITTNKLIYEKTSTGWVSYSITIVI